jgi:hypothetical protein
MFLIPSSMVGNIRTSLSEEQSFFYVFFSGRPCTQIEMEKISLFSVNNFQFIVNLQWQIC